MLPEGFGSPPQLPLPADWSCSGATPTQMSGRVPSAPAPAWSIWDSPHPIPASRLFGLVPPETSAGRSSRAATSAPLAGPSRTNPEKSITSSGPVPARPPQRIRPQEPAAVATLCPHYPGWQGQVHGLDHKASKSLFLTLW